MNEEQYGDIKVIVKKLLNINLDHYKDQQMKRRLDSWLVRSDTNSWQAYFKQLRTDSEEVTKLSNYITINVSSFFRDTERWESLQKNVLPQLIREAQARTRNQNLRIWSAGCSIGAEPYTLAMQLDEFGQRNGYYMLASDIDHGAMEMARNGGPYRAEDAENISPEQKQKYMLSGEKSLQVKPEIIKRVTFKHVDLVEDSFEGNFDLIVCRNVVIYFTAETKTKLFRKFCESLRPGGILFIGGTEIIPRSSDIGLKNIGISLYQRMN